nr:amino acid ABC transporter permease [Bordetella avium]
MDIATLKMYLTPLAEGSLWTLALFFCSAFLAVAVGLVVCLCRLSKSAVLSRAARFYIEVIRGTPLLLQLFYIYYGLPEMGVVIGGFTAGVLGLTLNFGAYLAELFRSGIQSVDSGQYEAARALGLSRFHQAARHCAAPGAAHRVSCLGQLHAGADQGNLAGRRHQCLRVDASR